LAHRHDDAQGSTPAVFDQHRLAHANIGQRVRQVIGECLAARWSRGVDRHLDK
jgi:hypothetical protein